MLRKYSLKPYYNFDHFDVALEPNVEEVEDDVDKMKPGFALRWAKSELDEFWLVKLKVDNVKMEHDVWALSSMGEYKRRPKFYDQLDKYFKR